MKTPEVKMFEIRDHHTMIPAVAVRISRDNGPLARHAGYGDPCVLLTNMNGGRAANYDVYAWGDRTMTVAHDFIARKWDTLATGAVVDVEHILGERPEPKTSDLF